MERKMWIVEEKAANVAAAALKAVANPPKGHGDLVNQFRRAVASVALNTAEGLQRSGADRAHLLRVALGSARESSMALRLLAGVGAVGETPARDIEAGLDAVRAMLWRLAYK